MCQIDIEKYLEWRTEYFQNEKYKDLRLGQAFVNDNFLANTATDPELFYSTDNVVTEQLIFKRYIKGT